MTEPVKRYLVPQSILQRANASFGESVVLASDYARLEQECERLRPLAEDRDQQYAMKVKARKQRDEIVDKVTRLADALQQIIDAEWTSSETATDFALSQTKGMLISRIKGIAREALSVKP